MLHFILGPNPDDMGVERSTPILNVELEIHHCFMIAALWSKQFSRIREKSESSPSPLAGQLDLQLDTSSTSSYLTNVKGCMRRNAGEIGQDNCQHARSIEGNCRYTVDG